MQNQKARNDANNANTVKNAAQIASKSANPYAKGIGTAVNVADKLSGGKASEKLGKTLTNVTKFSPGGKQLQKMSNKLSESGTSNRIANAVNKKNSSVSNGILNNTAMNNPQNKSIVNNQNMESESSLKEKTEEQIPDGGYTNFNVSVKVIKWGLIACAAIFPVIIFCCLFISASQIFLNSISLGTADSLSGQKVEEKINKKGTKDLDEEKTDDDVAYDIYISDTKSEMLKNSKLNNYNIIQVANDTTILKRKYNEASLDKIEDFYPSVKDLSKNYDENMVYDFFFKMYNLYITYRDNYNVYLDLPLLMSTLNLQSSDKNVVFSSNLGALYRTDNVNDIPKAELDYYYDWSSYKITRNNSEHDMEIIAQAMVSVREDSSENPCENPKDNKCYEIDNKKYKEFLKEFLEKKYFTTDGGIYSGDFDSGENNPNTNPNTNTNNNSNSNPGNNSNGNSNSNNSNNNTNNDSNKDGNYVKDVTYVNSSFGEVVYFNQGDYSDYYYSSEPTKKAEYGKATIKSHGCGPTSLAIVASSILNKNITPIETTSKVCKLGGCTSSGSRYTGLIDAGKEYGLKVTTTANNQEVINALSTNNSLVIVLMGPGTFTSGGHFIVLTGANSKGEVSVADPGSRKRTNQKWFSFNTVVEQRKTYAPYMIFSR